MSGTCLLAMPRTRTGRADIGRALGVGGHMGSLRRTAVGVFTDDTGVALDTLDDAVLAASLVPAAQALDLPRAVLTDSTLVDDIRHGRSLPLMGFADGDVAQVVDEAGELLALARAADGRLRPYKVFAA